MRLWILEKSSGLLSQLGKIQVWLVIVCWLYSLLIRKEELVGDPITAVDIQGAAGYGELVYFVTGGDAAFVSAEHAMPVDVAVVGIVDSITVTEEAEE